MARTAFKQRRPLLSRLSDSYSMGGTLQASQSWSAFLRRTVSSFWVFTSSFSLLRACTDRGDSLIYTLYQQFKSTTKCLKGLNYFTIKIWANYFFFVCATKFFGNVNANVFLNLLQQLCYTSIKLSIVKRIIRFLNTSVLKRNIEIVKEKD